MDFCCASWIRNSLKAPFSAPEDIKYTTGCHATPHPFIRFPCFLFCWTDGYISNTCVDIDYEAVKRSLLKSQKTDVYPLPPPPPDPPQMVNMDANRDRYSLQLTIWLFVSSFFSLRKCLQWNTVFGSCFFFFKLLFHLIHSFIEDEGKSSR